MNSAPSFSALAPVSALDDDPEIHVSTRNDLPEEDDSIPDAPSPWIDESSVALIDELPGTPSAALLYRRDLARYPWRTRPQTEQEGQARTEHEQALIERARAGELAAREEMITSLLHHVERFATRCFALLSWTSPHFDALDLVQAGSEAMLRCLNHALLAEQPFAYLLAVAYRAIRSYSRTYHSLICTPATPGTLPLPVESLDAPLVSDEGEDTSPLADLLATPVSTPPADAQGYTALYQAIEALPEHRRVMVVRHHGLYDQPAEALCDLSADLYPQQGPTVAGSIYRQAIYTLYGQLSRVYPQHYEQTPSPSPRPSYVDGLQLNPEQYQRLDQAYRWLEATGERITRARLAKEAGIKSDYAQAYLQQYRPAPPSVFERLDQAYAALAASGQPITYRRLIQQAQVKNDGLVCQYLHAHDAERCQRYLRRQQLPDRARRIEQAYATLQTSGLPITVERLKHAAQVDTGFAGAYLKQRRQQAGRNGYAC
jgi:DNA-directed RNA polymerase specialized sigma24 family protein